MEKRRTVRRESELKAEVYTRSEGIIAAGAENLCDEGVCLNLRSKLPAGAIVGVSMFRVDDGIEDPDVEPVNVPAQVVWCNKNSGPLVQAGMRFVDPQNLRSMG